MSLRRNALFVVPVMLGCWSLKPADEVPDGGADGGADVARSDVGADVAPSDVVNDASRQDVASMDASFPTSGVFVRFPGHASVHSILIFYQKLNQVYKKS